MNAPRLKNTLDLNGVTHVDRAHYAIRPSLADLIGASFSPMGYAFPNDLG